MELLYKGDLSIGVGNIDLIRFVSKVRCDSIEELDNGLNQLLSSWSD